MISSAQVMTFHQAIFDEWINYYHTQVPRMNAMMRSHTKTPWTMTVTPPDHLNRTGFDQGFVQFIKSQGYWGKVLTKFQGDSFRVVWNHITPTPIPETSSDNTGGRALFEAGLRVDDQVQAQDLHHGLWLHGRVLQIENGQAQIQTVSGVTWYKLQDPRLQPGSIAEGSYEQTLRIHAAIQKILDATPMAADDRAAFETGLRVKDQVYVRDFTDSLNGLWMSGEVLQIENGLAQVRTISGVAWYKVQGPHVQPLNPSHPQEEPDWTKWDRCQVGQVIVIENGKVKVLDSLPSTTPSEPKEEPKTTAGHAQSNEEPEPQKDGSMATSANKEENKTITRPDQHHVAIQRIVKAQSYTDHERWAAFGAGKQVYAKHLEYGVWMVGEVLRVEKGKAQVRTVSGDAWYLMQDSYLQPMDPRRRHLLPGYYLELGDYVNLRKCTGTGFRRGKVVDQNEREVKIELCDGTCAWIWVNRWSDLLI